MREVTIPLRLIVERPPAGVALAVQQGQGRAPELILPTGRIAEAVSFELSLRMRAGTPPVLLGDVVQGPPRARFLYVVWGRRAGQAASCWDRRAKISLTGLTPALLAAVCAAPGRVLEARIAGTGRDGSPACATVPLLGEGWKLGEACS